MSICYIPIPISTFVNYKGGIFPKKAYYTFWVLEVEGGIVKILCFAVREPAQRLEAVVC